MESEIYGSLWTIKCKKLLRRYEPSSKRVVNYTIKSIGITEHYMLIYNKYLMTISKAFLEKGKMHGKSNCMVNRIFIYTKLCIKTSLLG